MSDVSIKPRHDQRGIEIVTDNDIAYLSVEGALKLQEQLNAAIKHTVEIGPDAPAPLLLSGHSFTGKEKHFAETYPYEDDGIAWSGNMGGYELNVNNLHEIRNWCNDVLKYIRKKQQKSKKVESIECRGCGDVYKGPKYPSECTNCGVSL